MLLAFLRLLSPTWTRHASIASYFSFLSFSPPLRLIVLFNFLAMAGIRERERERRRKDRVFSFLFKRERERENGGRGGEGLDY
jgi:hypothetical protein